MKRLTRAEQTERNRALVLDAARRVFLARGYHGATLEQIADEAGFSKGVVYSQFDSKADLFLALLQARIEERAAENARLAESLAGNGGLPALVEHLARGDQATPGWWPRCSSRCWPGWLRWPYRIGHDRGGRTRTVRVFAG